MFQLYSTVSLKSFQALEIIIKEGEKWIYEPEVVGALLYVVFVFVSVCNFFLQILIYLELTKPQYGANSGFKILILLCLPSRLYLHKQHMYLSQEILYIFIENLVYNLFYSASCPFLHEGLICSFLQLCGEYQCFIVLDLPDMVALTVKNIF